ncbi:MAG: ABC transporter substrate-binding protein [Burkholderiales bacterium]|nr:ABC transporter substrate-binding protein [Burkholderiales bacterium]
MTARRRFLSRTRALGLVSASWPWMLHHTAHAQNPWRVAIAVPGPGNLLFLPITLASKLGMDHAEGITLDIRYVGGGPQAYRDMLERNTDFAAGGLAALALQKLSGKPVVCIAPVTQVPGYTLLVRASLRGRVRTISDLAGKVVGVKGHVPGGRSTSQLFTEHVLAENGVKPDLVNYVSVGQAYESQRAALASGTVDAVMGDEPFATRLANERVAFILADYHDLDTTRKQMGGLFLNGNIATREDIISSRPELAEKMVKTITRALLWINSHTAADMVAALAPEDAQERAYLLDVLKVQKWIYSPDGRISDSQVASVTRFLRATELTPAAQRFDVKTAVNARWAGTAP